MANAESNTPRPGREIEKILAEKGWTHDDLAAAIGKQRPHVTSLISGKRGVTPEWAALLARAIGHSPTFWLGLENERQLSLLPPVTDDVDRLARLVELVPVRELERRGWIPITKNVDELENALKQFFAVESLDEDPPVCAAARKANIEEPFDRQQRAWVARARQLATCVPAARFDRGRNQKMIAKLRHLAAYPKECLDVCEVLREYGIRFVVVEPLEKCRIDGAAFWIGDAPAVAVSMRYGRIDMFWFTLMHEIAHIVHDDRVSIDSNLAGKEQMPSRLKSEMERRADETAADWLIPSGALDEFIKLYSPLYSKTRIIQFAHRIKIHPGIIVGQLQHRGELGWNGGRGLPTDVRQYIVDSALTDGWGKTFTPGTLE